VPQAIPELGQLAKLRRSRLFVPETRFKSGPERLGHDCGLKLAEVGVFQHTGQALTAIQVKPRIPFRTLFQPLLYPLQGQRGELGGISLEGFEDYLAKAELNLLYPLV
jgi:hypothetical protein